MQPLSTHRAALWAGPILYCEEKVDQSNHCTSLFDSDSESDDGFNLYACAHLKDAVANASISRSHGMLIAALRDEVQETALTNLLSLPALPGVDDLRESIQCNAINLTEASFDTTDCDGCRFNSSNHQSLYSTAIDPGLCVNGACSRQKWQVSIENEANKLAGKYRVIVLAIEPNTRGYRESDYVDPNLVGPEQSESCRKGCEHFGAWIGGSPGQPTKIATNVCTNTQCNDSMQERHRAKTMETSKERLWRAILTKHVRTLPRASNRAMLMAMLSYGWTAGNCIKELLGAGVADATDPVTAWMTLSADEMMAAMDQASIALISNAPLHQVGQMLRSLKVNIADHSSMSPDFLKKLSVREIDDVLFDLQIPLSAELKLKREQGQMQYAQAAIALLKPETLVGYVPSVFRL